MSYFVVIDEARLELLLVAHRVAGLWLPPGGHVQPDEDPWHAVQRECLEELNVAAVPSGLAGDRPFFLTVTRTRGPGSHTDVSLWYVLALDKPSITTFDRNEFHAIRWIAPDKILDEPVDTLDPNMHRFTAKLLAAQG